ncbi:efflux RND transporter periplasmic adaptor subunit [Coraliomargarita sp. SDUM461003]|uniref:Efflux RND transporter periplasmic adaptor subunit n=1 Tax=Thalassobacterium maritimum TaxID=3041265 RepID=A0ABU1AT69_9BACT|nr:efflux RND transporter periplasmic adaptor subunit [Coraliomargarita sp. SDUM461003]MDQ8206439.1 efflux RND transporter periplasmic adaptor subunit [Coraliomargarita sp. SDUM461003]
MNTNDSNSDISLADAIQKGRPNSKKRARLISALVILLLALALWQFLGSSAKPQHSGPQFSTAPLKRGEISLTITATGNLEPTNEVTVGSELSGTAREVYVDYNDRVTKGQAMMRLDTTTLENTLKAGQADLESAKANLAQAKVSLKEAQATLQRQQELHTLSEGRIPSKADLSTTEASAERAAAEVLSAEAAIEQAQAEINIIKSNLDKSIIRSPVDGIVLSRSIDAGQTVAASYSTPELFVVAEDLSQMKLEVTVAEADIGRVESGQSATFQVDAWPDRTYQAEVLKVSYGSSETDNVVTYETELSASNEDLSLRPGMTATADIHVAQHSDVLLVPIAALRFEPTPPDQAPKTSSNSNESFLSKLMPGPPRRGGSGSGRPQNDNMLERGSGSTIWILQDNRPSPIEVTIGLSNGRYTEVSGDGLNEGSEVILSESI